MNRYNAKDHERSRVLDDDELRAVWNAAATGGAFGSFVCFLLLTGCRRGEAHRLVWSELEDGRWRVPEARNKTKQELERPLSKAAQAIIADQPRIDGVEFVFTNRSRPISLARGKKEIDLGSGVSGWRLHDLRRSARTLMSRAGVNADIAERCLGHVIGGVRGVYDKHGYRREVETAFEALAKEIGLIVSPPKDVVTPLRRPARS